MKRRKGSSTYIRPVNQLSGGNGNNNIRTVNQLSEGNGNNNVSSMNNINNVSNNNINPNDISSDYGHSVKNSRSYSKNNKNN